ncbi:MAG: blaR [Clostridiales bacterium]|nr:blaR [Clostridiales bacterium]
MKQSNNDITSVMDNVLQQHITSVQFEDVWKTKVKNEKSIFGNRNTKVTPLIAVIALLALFMVGFTGYTVFRNMDKTDYPFTDDPRVIGKWETVDFVNSIEEFNPEEKNWKSDMYLTSLIFVKEGKMLLAIEDGNIAYTPATWTKDMLLNKQEKTASKYVIEEINGSTYMFCEWKSGDYMFRNAAPSFYVLKKVDSEDYSSYQVKTVMEDSVDYPFVDDENMKGKWESVDFVRTIDSFKPVDKYWLGDLFLRELKFEENGVLRVKIDSGRSGVSPATWTKGLIIDKRYKTASKCEIKEIDGVTYMFYEWKSGDYVYRGMEPCYYVLKKVK